MSHDYTDVPAVDLKLNNKEYHYISSIAWNNRFVSTLINNLQFMKHYLLILAFHFSVFKSVLNFKHRAALMLAILNKSMNP